MVVVRANSPHAPPPFVDRGSAAGQPHQVSGCGFAGRCYRARLPWHAARARVAPWITSRPPTEHALRAADFARLSARPIRDALHPTPLAEALLHRHRTRSADAATHCRWYRSRLPWRAARARVVPWITSRPSTENALRAVDLARLSARSTHDALRPTPLAEALLYQPCAGSTAAASRRRNQSFLVPWRAARAHFVTWRTSRSPTEHALRAADLARLSARPTRETLYPTPLAEALLHRHRAG